MLEREVLVAVAREEGCKRGGPVVNIAEGLIVRMATVSTVAAMAAAISIIATVAGTADQ